MKNRNIIWKISQKFNLYAHSLRIILKALRKKVRVIRFFLDKKLLKDEKKPNIVTNRIRYY